MSLGRISDKIRINKPRKAVNCGKGYIMKHSQIKFEVEFKEGKYTVEKSFHVFAWSDNAIMMTIAEEVNMWLNKKIDYTITISGHGCYNDYGVHMALLRIVKRYNEKSIITWRDGHNTGDRAEYSDNKSFKADIDKQLRIIAGMIDYNDHC